ncbi:MAG: Crp/Fnr family transcriptional regulator [Solirubrobacteraceae bacterium]
MNTFRSSLPASPAPTPFVPPPEVIAILDVDQDLGRSLPASQRAAVAHAARARLLRIPQGAWEPEERGGMGHLIVSGLLARTVRLGRREALELLGPGDLIRPAPDDVTALIECEVAWQVVSSACVAVLDARFARMTSRWPQLTTAIVDRGLRRARWLAIQAAIASHPTVDERLMLMFCHLGERLGRMTPRGVAMDLPLSHRLLAHSVRALRPAVTVSLQRLRDAGRIEQTSRGRWLITHDGLAFADSLCRQPAMVVC